MFDPVHVLLEDALGDGNTEGYFILNDVEDGSSADYGGVSFDPPLTASATVLKTGMLRWVLLGGHPW